MLLFQDEARFGRMSDPVRCWAPRPVPPMVLKALVREFLYVYAALGPQEGTLDWMVAVAMNTDLMGAFLSQVGIAHPDREILMVLDGASPQPSRPLFPLSFIDLRHEALNRLFEKGFDTMEVRTITGHKTLQMLARHTHLMKWSLPLPKRPRVGPVLVGCNPTPISGKREEPP